MSGERAKSENLVMPISENVLRTHSATPLCLDTLWHRMHTAWFRISSSLSVIKNKVL